MTDNRAKALEALEKTIDLVDHDSDEPIPTPFKNFLSAEVYETIKEALTEPKWKSMENFPVDYREHLFFDGKNVCQGFLQWDKYYGYYYTSTTGSEIKPTHWMHLPDAPTGGES